MIGENMKVDSVITLENDVNCLLLDKTNYNDSNYFLAILLDENEEPTDKSLVLKETIENNEIYVEEEVDQKVLEEVTKLFTKSFNKYVSELPDTME